MIIIIIIIIDNSTKIQEIMVAAEPKSLWGFFRSKIFRPRVALADHMANNLWLRLKKKFNENLLSVQFNAWLIITGAKKRVGI